MTNNNKKQTNLRSDSFFEAFRELGKDTARTGKDTVRNMTSDMIGQVMPGSRQPLSGEIRANQAVDFEAEIVRREQEARKKERAHFEYVKRKEQLVFSRKQEEIKAQIEAIQEELKKIIGEASELTSEVELAVEQSIVNPGIYHLNFFNKLRQILILLRKKITDSKTWMHTVNSRAKHRSFFWAQVSKSGTKYMLSQERYMSTQAG